MMVRVAPWPTLTALEAPSEPPTVVVPICKIPLLTVVAPL